MTRWILWLIALTGLEEAVSYWVIPFSGSNNWLIVPHLVLIRLIVWTYQSKENEYGVIWYALVFGLIQDLMIGSPLLGAHAFSYALTVLVIERYALLQPNPDTPRWIGAFSIGIFTTDLTLYVLNRMFSQTDASFFWILGQHVLPNLISHVMILFIGIGLRQLWQSGRMNGV